MSAATFDLGRIHADNSDRFIGLLARTWPLAEAEDAVAEAFARAWRRRDELQGPDANVAGYIFVIARRILIRQRRHLPLLIDVAASESDPSEWCAFRDAVDKLPRLQRMAMVARMLGLSYGQTMAATGQTYTWVNRHTVEGRSALRGALTA